jgi:hypothetical protein
MASTFGRIAFFIDAKFRGDATFGAANLGGAATFGADADFGGAKFSGEAGFSGAKFGAYANFMKAEFDNKLKLGNFKSERLYITWNSIKDELVYSGPAYLALIKNFKALEQFDDADDCYYQYRRESQDRKKLYDNEKGWDWSKFMDIISWISCGYGVRPLHTVLSIFGVVFIIGIIFLGYFDSIFESFYFSIMTFTGGLITFTGGEADILIEERWLRSLAMIEAILGYLLMALFVVVLARKFIR